MSELAPETGSIQSPEAAAQALASAVLADDGREAPGMPGPGAAPGNDEGNQPEAASTSAVDDEPGTSEQGADSGLRSADVDLSHLPPEAQAYIQAREREMQGDYTRKTQELSEKAKQYEALGDPAQAREALAFYQGIRTDPNYAAEVYDFLTQQLMSAGYSPAAAAAKALATVNEQTEQEPAQAPPSFDDDPDGAIQARFEELDREQKALRAELQAREQREVEAQMANEILRQENVIRQSAPDITDEEVDLIYNLAESTQGNLFEAYRVLDQQKQSWLKNYIDAKQTSVEPDPAAAPQAAPVTRFQSLDQAHAAALEHLRADMTS